MLYSAGFLHSFWWLSNTALIGYTTFFYFISWWICHWLFEETRPIVLQIVLHAGSLLPPNAGSLVAPSCFSHRLERNPHSRKLGCQIVCGRTTWRSCLRCRNLGPISRESDLVDLRGAQESVFLTHQVILLRVLPEPILRNSAGCPSTLTSMALDVPQESHKSNGRWLAKTF